MAGKRFRVALSFAGEKRDFVAKVAALLAQRFGEKVVLYDKYHRAEFSRADLAFHLADLYEQQADLVVAVLCPDYEKKEWCGLEWNAVFGLLKQRTVGEVMLTRFGQVEGKGLRGLAGYTDLDGMTPEQAADDILERLAINEGQPVDIYKRSTHGAGSNVSKVAPNNLPRQAFFFGRESELTQIAEALATDARSWGVLIDGPGGIGKTALAIQAAAQVPVERFKRIVFLSAKERELTADGQRELGGFVLPTALEMFNAIAREVGQTDLARAPEGQRSESLLRALRGLDLLLVLDNLETLPAPDRDQLFAFLNRLPRGSSAIVTSRRRADAGAVSIRLDRLEWPAAQQMLAALTRQWPELACSTTAERQQLHEQTGGNPLLMRWVAGQLGRARYRSLGDALALLRSPEAGNNPLEFVFGDLLDAFTSPETQVLAALSHFTLPATVQHLTEATQLNMEAAQAALFALASRALVLPDKEERHFAIVPLVADYLRRSRPDAIANTGDRLAQRAYALALENGYDEHELFEVLEANWPTITAAIPLLLNGPNDRLQTVCGALQDFLDFTGRWDEWLALSRDAEAKALAGGDTLKAGWRAYNSGWVHYLRGQSSEVLACVDRAAIHWRSAGECERANAIRLRGLGHQIDRNHTAAIEAYREALDLYRSFNYESAEVAMVLNDIASIERETGRYDDAESNYLEALRIANLVDNPEGIAIDTGNLAALALDRKDWPRAEILAREALALSERLGRQELNAANCQRIAKAMARQGHKDQAMPFARRAVAIFSRLGAPDLANAQATLAECEQP